ncbi:sensor histidine kinase [Diaminobutyricimonas sp. LJ205]|uniref:sensor histidine kinase n=1 Tax=Diaminobutyricimonas sp. LJ205 TaxID=2683590 RepID=UPI0012F49919|nr:ATP-binding protein [Diaminobutyricimonas sp. LJ205]
MHSAVPPRILVAVAMRRGVSLATRATGVFWLLAGAALLIDVLAGLGRLDVLPLPLLFLFAQLAMYLLYIARPRRDTAVLYLFVGSLAVAGFQLSLLAELPTLDDNAMLVSRGALVLTLLGRVGTNPISTIGWSVAGLGAGTIVSLLPSLLLDADVRLGAGPALAAITFSATVLACWLSSRVERRQLPDLRQLDLESARLAADRDAERRLAAIAHDTVLADLVALSHNTGPLDDATRARLRADATELRSATLSGGGASPTTPASSGELTTLVRAYADRDLAVDISGDDTVFAKLDDAGQEALLAAIRACLDNVVRHSGVAAAEVFIDSDERQATVMVMDRGVGFETDSIEPDRLGVRNSIVGRLRRVGGRATIWSRPGIGTSAILSVPLVAVEASRET